MVTTQFVLVDSSIWIPFLRIKNSPQTKALDQFLSLGQVATCNPIRAEIISEAPTQQALNRLRNLFSALIQLNPPDDIWEKIEESRFTLARKGLQTSLIDLWIAITAQHNNIPLWTFDEDFNQIKSVIPIELCNFR